MNKRWVLVCRGFLNNSVHVFNTRDEAIHFFLAIMAAYPNQDIDSPAYSLKEVNLSDLGTERIEEIVTKLLDPAKRKPQNEGLHSDGI